MRVIAIDPGMRGGVALLDTHADSLLATPLPYIGKDLDYRRLHQAIQVADPHIIVIEKVHAMPNQGVTSMFNFGMGYGSVVALASVSKARLVLVPPQVWKKHVLAGTSKDKDAAIQFCNQTYPSINLVLPKCRKPHDGMADAICMAHYGAHYIK